MPPKVPERIRWAVELIDVRPDDRILELGYGPGVAAALIGERLVSGGGELVAVDRSATAIERAQACNAEPVAAGRITFQQVELAGLVGRRAWFDKALGINVNVFWTSTADAELGALAGVLRPCGTLYLVYEGPPGGSARNVGPGIAARLERHGFAAEVIRGDAAGRMLCVTGRLL